MKGGNQAVEAAPRRFLFEQKRDEASRPPSSLGFYQRSFPTPCFVSFPSPTLLMLSRASLAILLVAGITAANAQEIENRQVVVQAEAGELPGRGDSACLFARGEIHIALQESFCTGGCRHDRKPRRHSLADCVGQAFRGRAKAESVRAREQRRHIHPVSEQEDAALEAQLSVD